MLLKPLKATAELQAMLAQSFVRGSIPSAAGGIPSLQTKLGFQDRLGTIKVRLGLGRNRYRVIPGLYAIGQAQAASPVLVTANYKLSLDSLRKELGGVDAWILVLDTKGVNVWCAAGKGNFGNKELGRRIAASRLHLVIKTRDLILPQLAATGISAPLFLKEVGWKIHFGPVLAKDIPAYLEAGLEKTQAMGRVEFRLRDRLVLGPLEFVASLKVLGPGLAALLALGLIRGLIAKAGSPLEGLAQGGLAFLPLLLAAIGGTILFSALLPILPGRAFTLKGAALGLILALAWIWAFPQGLAMALALILAMPAITAWYGLAFTGSTTFTSLSGVALEVKWGRLPIFLAGGLGLGLQAFLLALGH